MAGAIQARWWVKTERLAATILSGFAAVACVPLLFAAALDRDSMFGLPLGYLLLVLAVPLVLAMAIFWFADRQSILDRRYDMVED